MRRLRSLLFLRLSIPGSLSLSSYMLPGNLHILHGVTFSLEFLIMLADNRLTYEKADVILLHLIQTDLQKHLNWSDATEGNGFYLAMVRLLNQFT